jgi:hypothetical protein
MPEMKRFGLTRVRELADKRVSASSLRAVAEDIGMSFSGLRKFLAGSDPHPGTVKKLTAWYVRSRVSGPPQPKPSARPERAEIDAAIQLLIEFARADEREEVRLRRIREIVERLKAGVSDAE